MDDGRSGDADRTATIAGTTASGAARAAGTGRAGLVERASDAVLRAWTVALHAAMPILPWFALAWTFGVTGLSIRVFVSWLAVRRLAQRHGGATTERWKETLARLSTRLGVSRAVRLCESAAVEVPTVIGWFRPVILLPARAITGLDRIQIEALLAHELAHIRRLDFLVNLVQTAVETLLFYHPAVWWVSHRVRADRELCCDDLAVAACGDRITYARALAALESQRSAGFALAASGGSLVERVRRLAHGPQREDMPEARWVSGLGVLAVAFVLSAASRPAAGTGEHTAAAPAHVEAGVAGVSRSARLAPYALESSAAATSRPVRVPTYALFAPDPDLPMLAEHPIVEGDHAAPEAAPPGGPARPRTFLEGLAAEGVQGLNVEELIKLKSTGVEPEFVAAVRRAGLGNPDVEGVIRLRNAGVTPAYLAGLGSRVRERLSLDDVVRLATNSVSPEYAATLHVIGYRFSADELIRLSTNAVRPEYVARLRVLAAPPPTVDDLVRLSTSGVRAEDAAGFQALGLSLSVDGLVRLATQGVTVQHAEEAVRLVGRPLSADELLRLHLGGRLNGEGSR